MVGNKKAACAVAFDMVSAFALPSNDPHSELKTEQSPPPSLTGLLESELSAAMEEMGERRYRTRQILEWVYRGRVTGFEAMSNLGQGLREELGKRFRLGGLEVVRRQGSSDTTQKYLFRLHDGRLIESVLIRANPGADGIRAGRATLCVSSQVGCAFDCKFCASGLAGFARNLDAGEIVDQVLGAEREGGRRVDNIVFMGMGEPLANLANVLKAVEIINAPWGLGIGARHITISTSGLAPQIRKLAEYPLQVRLAVSLHGATDEVRERIMPVNQRFPLSELFDSLRYFGTKKKQKITFEYILIRGVNDSVEDAEALARRAIELSAKVNVIPYNTVEGLAWERPSQAVEDAFMGVLVRAGAVATIRREKGHDIDAACGQLRLREESASISAGVVAHLQERPQEE